MRIFRKTKYAVGEKYYGPYKKGCRCLGMIIRIEDGKYELYNFKYGRYTVTKEQLDACN